MSFTMGELVEKALPRTERYRFDLVELLKHGGVAVIVGGRSTNFTDEMRRDPRLEFWDSTDPKSQSRLLPSNARALLFTRFISHELDGRLREQARRRGVFCKPGVHETGELRAQLQRVIDHAEPVKDESETFEALVAKEAAKLDRQAASAPPQPIVETEESPAMKKRTAGEVSAFVRKHANITLRMKDRGVEAARVAALAKKQGLRTTPATVLEYMRLQAREAGIPGMMKSTTRANGGIQIPTKPIFVPPPLDPEPEPVESLDPDPVPVEAPVVGSMAPPPMVAAVSPPPSPADRMVETAKALVAEPRRFGGSGETLIQAISEAEKYISDMQAASALLADLMPRLKSAIADFRERQRRAAEIFLD